MLKTIVLTGEWQELPVDIGSEVKKLSDRITKKDKLTDSFWALYDSLCIAADEDNVGTVLVSDYTEANQEIWSNVLDYIELWPKGRIELPWNRELMALNRPMVMWQAWDVLKIVAR